MGREQNNTRLFNNNNKKKKKYFTDIQNCLGFLSLYFMQAIAEDAT